MVFRLYWKQAGDRQNMIIRQLNIKNSGEIHDKTLEFSPGDGRAAGASVRLPSLRPSSQARKG